MDQTEVKTPNPCILSPEEQDQLRSILKRFDLKTGNSKLPANIFIDRLLSTSNNNKGSRVNIDKNGLNIYDQNGVLVLTMPLGNNAAYLLLDAIFGLTGTLNLYSADGNGQLQIVSNELVFRATLGGTLLDILSSGATIKPAVNLTNLINKYKNIQTAGWGVPAIYANARSNAQTAAVASVATYTLAAADASFLIFANIQVTAAVTCNFTVTVAYTDETNSARTLTLSFSNPDGTHTNVITNTSANPLVGIPLQIRCKALTAITIATVGTFTSVTYNVEGSILQVA